MGLSKYNVPNEEAKLFMRLQIEDSKPHWDSSRLNEIAIFNICDVLLLRTVNGLSRRMGTGKISYYTFLVTKPEEMLANLA